MSADNWAICPRCKVAEKAKLQKAVEAAGEAYGKVSPAEYLRLLQGAEREVELDTTLREDYEIGINQDGKFNISYHAACERCELRFSHSYTQELR